MKAHPAVRRLLLIVGVLTAGPLCAQGNGIQLGGAIGLPPVVNAPLGTASPVVLLIGYEHDLSGHLGYDVQLRYAGVSRGPQSLEVLYASRYSIGDNSGTALHLGPLLGLRHVWGNAVSYTNSLGTSSQHYSTYQVPVGFRLSVRGGLGHLALGAYVEAGYLLGGNASLYTVDDATVGTRSAFAFIGGYYSFGW